MYTKIESQFWKDEKMLKVSSDARCLMLYLLTSPHRNMIACYFLPISYACFDLGWLPERFTKGLHELIGNGRVKYDNDNHILLIPNYLKFNPLENPNQVKSAIQKLNELPQTILFQALYEAVIKIEKPFLKPLIERLQERLVQPVYSNSNSNSIQDINIVQDDAGADKEETHADIAVNKKEPAPYSEILSFLNETAGTKYRLTEKHKKHIHARWCEGYTLEDFKTVINKKAAEWLVTDQAKYLRPETLFGTKFDGYLNQLTGGNRNGKPVPQVPAKPGDKTSQYSEYNNFEHD